MSLPSSLLWLHCDGDDGTAAVQPQRITPKTQGWRQTTGQDMMRPVPLLPGRQRRQHHLLFPPHSPWPQARPPLLWSTPSSPPPPIAMTAPRVALHTHAPASRRRATPISSLRHLGLLQVWASSRLQRTARCRVSTRVAFLPTDEAQTQVPTFTAASMDAMTMWRLQSTARCTKQRVSPRHGLVDPTARPALVCTMSSRGTPAVSTTVAIKQTRDA